MDNISLVILIWTRCDSIGHGCANHDTEGKRFNSPSHCCDATKPPYLISGELCTSPLHCELMFVYIVCCRRTGQCFSLLRTRNSDVRDSSSGRSYVTQQWHNVPLLRTRALYSHPSYCSSLSYRAVHSCSFICHSLVTTLFLQKVKIFPLKVVKTYGGFGCKGPHIRSPDPRRRQGGQLYVRPSLSLESNS